MKTTVNIDLRHLKAAFLFTANTGVRISELINLTWSDVNFQNMTIRISNKDDFETKSKKERTIALNETAYNVLAGME